MVRRASRAEFDMCAEKDRTSGHRMDIEDRREQMARVCISEDGGDKESGRALASRHPVPD